MTDKGEYNPYENRNVESPLSNFGACVTLMNFIIGTGILATPVAFYYAGIVNGIILLIVVTFMLLHGMQLLIYTMVECSRQMQVGYASYPESLVYSFRQGPDVFKSFAKAGGYFVDIVLALNHYGTCVAYIVFLASNLKQIADNFYQELDVRVYVMIIGLFSIPVFLIQSLKWLVPFNLLSVIFSYSGIVVMFYYLVTDLTSLSERYILFGVVEKIGLFFSIVLFSVSSVGGMLVIEEKMARPQDYPGWFGILDLSLFGIVLSYALLGFFGYWRYGDKVADSVSLNLPTNEPIALVSTALIAGGVFLTYPLSGYVVIDIIMNHWWNPYDELSDPKRQEARVRVLFVVLTTVNGVLAPKVGPLLMLLGVFCISLLNLILPALMEICLYYPQMYNYGRYKCMLVKDLTLVIIGSIILIDGTVFSLVDMVDKYGLGGKYQQKNNIADNTTIEATGATEAPSFNP